MGKHADSLTLRVIRGDAILVAADLFSSYSDNGSDESPKRALYSTSVLSMWQNETFGSCERVIDP